MPKQTTKTIELWHRDGNVVGAETKVYRNGELANTKGKYEHLFINNITMPKDNQEKEVDFLLKATGNGGVATQSEFMPKDYQEIEKIAKDLWRHIHFLSGENDARAILRITQVLTTYGNARELQGVEKVEKGVPAEKEHDREDSIFEDSNKAAHNICRNITLDHIERVKKELN